jgi:transposase
VLAFWQLTDSQATGRHAFTAELFVRPVAEFVPHLTQPTVLMLDNASIHKAHLVKAHVVAWAAGGLTLLCLPPYSPELNQIEILWRFCKYYWLTPEAYQTPQPLFQQVTDLLRVIGITDYRITFG